MHRGGLPRMMPRSIALAAVLAGTALPGAAAETVAASVLRVETARPLPISRLDLPTEDLGFAGAELAVADNNTTGSFMGQEFTLEKISVPPEEAVAALQGLMDRGVHFIATLADADSTLALADAAGDRVRSYEYPFFPFMKLRLRVHELLPGRMRIGEMSCEERWAEPTVGELPWTGRVCYEADRLRVEAVPVDHTVPCWAYALVERVGRSRRVRVRVVYVTDTCWSAAVRPELVKFCRGAERLYCETQSLKPGIAGEDAATCTLRHRSGAVSVVDFSYAARRDPDPFPESLLEIEGRRGSLIVTPGLELTLHADGKTSKHTVRVPLRSWMSEQWYVSQQSVVDIQRHWIDCIRAGREPDTSGRDNLKTYALVEAAYESARTHQAVTPKV